MKNEGDNGGSSILILTIAASLGSIVLPQILESRWKISAQSLSKSAALGALCSTTSVVLVVGLEVALLSVDNFVADKYLVWYEENKNINLKKGGYMTSKLDTRIGSLLNATGLNTTEAESEAAAEKVAAEKVAEGKDESLEEAEESEIVAKMAFDAIAKTLPSDPNSFYRLTKGAKNVAFEALARDLKCQQHHDSLEDLVKAFEGTSYEEIMEAKMESYSPILHRFESIYGQVECPHDDL